MYHKLDELEDIKDAFNNSIIEFSLDVRLGYIYLELIRVRPSYQRKGIGKAAMKALIKWCNKNKMYICLWATTDYGTPVQILHQFYKGLGFVYNRGKKRNHRFNYEFVKYPT